MYLFTDGAAINNGKPNCESSWAWALYRHGSFVKGDCGLTTWGSSNNVGELEAIIRGVESNEGDLTVVYDSKYAALSLVGEYNGSKNAELIKWGRSVLNGRNLSWIHVRSHTARPTGDSFMWDGNNMADMLASGVLGGV